MRPKCSQGKGERDRADSIRQTTGAGGTQPPKLDERDDYIFLVLHWPIYNKITRLTTANEVDIFLGKDYVITSHSGHLRPLLRLFQQCLDDEEVRDRVLRRSSGYLFYRIMDKLVDYCFAPLNK